MPPRWALGNFASRFGYRNDAEVRATAAKFKQTGFPVDALILDLYWFGPDIKGHMGNLAWDKKVFPDPEGLIADLKKNGINTILITEPFILTSSKRWQEAVNAGAISTSTNCFAMASAALPSTSTFRAMMPPKAEVGSVWRAFA